VTEREKDEREQGQSTAGNGDRQQGDQVSLMPIILIPDPGGVIDAACEASVSLWRLAIVVCN
jgi:hypothetical protein